MIDGSDKSKSSIANHNKEELMNKPNSQKLIQWLVTAVFVVVVATFSLFDQPNAQA
jgi:hypothetical protein